MVLCEEHVVHRLCGRPCASPFCRRFCKLSFDVMIVSSSSEFSSSFVCGWPRACENDDVAFLERVGLLLPVALLTSSAPRSCFRPGTRGLCPCCLFSPRSSAHSLSCMDGAFVLERAGLLPVGFPCCPLNVLASVVELMGLLPVALPQRSDTDMPRSACFQPKTTIIEAQTRQNGTISGVQHTT